MSHSLISDVFCDSYYALIGFVARRTGNRQTAQDLVHDAWLRLAERERRGDEGSETASRAYLYTVADNLAIDHLRRAGRTAERFEGSGNIDVPAAAAVRDIADGHLHREALAAIDAALAALPERRRAIFLADRLDGTAHAVLAQQHGVSVKTIEREVMRALDAVEAALHRWRGDGTAQRRGRRRALSTLLGVGGLGLFGSTAWQAWRHLVPGWQMVVATARGQQLEQPLPDGSRIALDAQGRAEVRYYAARREVALLAGTAFFNVTADAERPFIVEALGARITVVGTRFEVAVGDSGDLRVMVEQGHVRVQPPGAAQHDLHAGDALRWSPDDGVQRAQSQGEVAPWRSGWLDFRHVPLHEAVQRLARYSPFALRVAPDAADLTVFGRVRIAEAGAWLRLLPGSLPVTVREEGRGAERALLITRR
ncbi:sigma-70 family RNA polymerase sigma factor [Pantoea sp. 18069]|uniref:sigma-70 family RNA polymerase sigma factor n=1 Tax=Pantoea sp. 18069 TaxID=2681415 RepID=UPI0013594885|nr:sigma-70 family RNA polymerase sigma factor [Pantoea sp. 18069]